MSHWVIPSSNEFLFSEWLGHLSLERFKCNFLCHCMFDLGGRPWLGDLAHFQKPLVRFLPQRFGWFLFWFRFGHQHDINDQTPTICKLVSFHVVWPTSYVACWSSRQCTRLMVLLPCPLIGSGRVLQAGCEAFFLSCTTAGASKLLLSNVMMWRPPLPLFATLSLKCLNRWLWSLFQFCSMLKSSDHPADTCYLHRQKDRYRSIQQKPQLNSETDM